MTTVETVFKYQGTLDSSQARNLAESFTHLGLRKVRVDEKEQTVAVEYDATRMDRHGVAALLLRLRIPVLDPVTP